MSEDVTYADLKFQDSSQTKNIQTFDNLEEKVYITSKTEMGKLNKLQDIKEELERNVSLQLVSNTNISKKIVNLSITMQELATKLCYELYRRQTEHKCKPCPERWIWHEDNCYGLFDNLQTWQKGEELCSAKKASLLKIKNKRILEFVKSQNLRNYWLGLSPRKDYRSYDSMDEKIISSNWYIRDTHYLTNDMSCGYIEKMYIYYDLCTERRKTICEKLANPVKIESMLTIKDPDGRL
ncbi:C-type lectin domain family 12 member A isoform X2 [Tamandua tetradactyla]|uniref:C-type lectin domain family 12 member A isoform X2 n=1 Tax=Tamandua tetradactyla TaxID=48850 RepID=UPI0040546B33